MLVDSFSFHCWVVFQCRNIPQFIHWLVVVTWVVSTFWLKSLICFLSSYFGPNTLLSGTGSKEPTCNAGEINRSRFDPWVGKIAWRRAWWPTAVILPGESHGQRRLGARAHGVTKSQTRLSEWVHTHESGTPPPCWWATEAPCGRVNCPQPCSC